MDFSKILAYQKKDGELFRIEKELNQSQSKKTYNEMINIVKKAQEKSSILESRAEGLEKDYQSIKNAYDNNIEQMSKFISKDLDKVSEKDLESIINVTNSILNNLNILEKRLFSEAENLNVTLNEFENAKKTYGGARAKYSENRKIYEEELKVRTPQIEAIKAELASLEKDIEPKLLAKYKQLRSDRIHPAFVSLSDKSCGGCRMQLSAAEVEKVKANGYMECDNCHRIIFD